MSDMPLNQKVFLAQFNAIRKIADEGACVMIGRCSDYALAENPNLLSIYIHADMQTRIRRIAAKYDLTDAKAKERIQKTDKKRASYYNYYTSKRWGDADSYHLTLDSGILGIQGCVDTIKKVVEWKEKSDIDKQMIYDATKY